MMIQRKSVELNGVTFYLVKKTDVEEIAKRNANIARSIENGDFTPLNAKWYAYKTRVTRDDVCKASGIGKDHGMEGVYDTAVPQPWRDKPEIKKLYGSPHYDWAVWYYSPKDSFGRPVWGSVLWEIVKEKLRKEIPESLRKGMKKPVKKGAKKTVKRCKK